MATLGMEQFNKVGRCRKCGRAIHSTDSFSYQVTGNDAYYVCESCLKGESMSYIRYPYSGQNSDRSNKSWIDEMRKLNEQDTGFDQNMVNMANSEPEGMNKWVREMMEGMTYHQKADITIEMAKEIKYTDAKQMELLAQVALGLAWIADELAAMRRGGKGLSDPSVEIAHVEYSEAECGREK